MTVRQIPSAPLCMLMGVFCHSVKSPNNCTLFDVGAKKVKVCMCAVAVSIFAFSRGVPALPISEPVFLVIFFFAIISFPLRLPRCAP